MANNLAKIVKEAKKIRKEHPNMQWKNALKEAGVHLRNAIKPVVSVAKHKTKKSIKRGLISLAKSKHLSGLPFTYKGYDVEQLPNGYWTTKSNNVGYLKADTKEGIKTLINAELKKKINGVQGWTKGNTRFVEKNEIPKRVSRNHPTLVVERAKRKRLNHKKGTFKHFVQIGAVLSYKNPDMAMELKMYGDNDSKLYFSRKLPIIKNLEKKYKKGTFDFEKSIKLWRYFVDDVMQKYHKDFGSRGKWYAMLDTSDRNLLAREFAEDILVEFEAGNFTI